LRWSLTPFKAHLALEKTVVVPVNRQIYNEARSEPAIGGLWVSKISPEIQAEGATLHSIRDQVSVLNLAEGFFHSSILFALLELRVFELIGDKEKAAEELAAKLGTDTGTLSRLLNAGVAVKLLEAPSPGRYCLSPMARSALLSSAEEGYIGNWIQNLTYFQRALSKLDEAVLNSAPTVDPFCHLGADQKQTESFILAMHDYAALRGKELARYLDTSECESLLDVGCGPGTYAFNLGVVNCKLKLHLMDLPEVLEVAKTIQTKYPLRNEIQYLPRDVTGDHIPGQFDVVLVSNVLHMLGHEASANLIKLLYHSVKPGGSLVIQAQFLRDDLQGDRWPVLLDLIQLCITSTGANHSVSQTRRWMEEAGFQDCTFCSMSLLNSNSFLRAYKRP
jgi:SAM-dependent methyltransferase